MDSAGGPNVLHLHLNELNGICTINNQNISHQTMTLKSYRIQFTTATDVTTIPNITFDASFMSSRAFTVGSNDATYNINNKGLVLLNSSNNGEIISCDVDLELNQDIPQKFNYNITSNSTITGFESLDLIFNYSVGS